MIKQIECEKCGWEWNTKDSKEFDKYVCHKCGYDNSKYYKLEFEKGGKINNMNNKTELNGSTGGMLVGKRHSEGGIKAINKSSNTPIEMEGGEVVITRNAVSDDSKREFEGKMMTNREILSKINQSGGGVSFAEGGKIKDCACSGKEYKYGGKTMSDHDIVKEMRELYPDDFEKGKLFGYYFSISNILSQAVGFGVIDKLPLKLREFNPESLLNETTL
jgi:hypothetical protein